MIIIVIFKILLFYGKNITDIPLREQLITISFILKEFTLNTFCIFEIIKIYDDLKYINFKNTDSIFFYPSLSGKT